MTINIMDANAITAFLRGEAGGEVVAAYLVDPAATNIIHAVNLCEVYYDALRAGGQAAADEAVSKTTAAGTDLRHSGDRRPPRVRQSRSVEPLPDPVLSVSMQKNAKTNCE